MARQILFRVHALRRMFERVISVPEVIGVLEAGETIARYTYDRPYSSRLMLGWSGDRPLHVVAADDPTRDISVVITAYEPHSDLWSADSGVTDDLHHLSAGRAKAWHGHRYARA